MQFLTLIGLTLSASIQFLTPFQSNTLSIPANNAVNLRYAQADLGSDRVSLNELNLQGNGVTVQQNQTKGLVMTTSTAQASSIFLKEQLKTSEDQPGFSTYFVMNVYRLNPGPADGYVFVIAANSNSLGQSGGGLGYAGINNSVGIEFDFYNNGGENIASSEIFTNGQTFSSAGTVFDNNYINQWNTKSAGQLVRAFHTWIEYDHANTQLELRVALADVESAPTPARPVNALISRTINLTQISDFFYAGFTAATGGLAQQMAVKSWYLSNRYIAGGIDPNSQSNVVDNEGPSAPVFEAMSNQESYDLSINGSVDAQSATVGYQWQLNNQGWSNYQDTFNVSEVGEYKARAYDEAGNFSSITSLFLYRIRFMINNVEHVSVLKTNQEENITIDQSFALDGYTYTQWYDNAQFSGQPITSITQRTQSMTLYGKPTANVYAIAYELNGGLLDSSAPFNFSVGESLQIPQPTKLGHSFVGWYLDDAFTTALNVSSLPFESITLFARWILNTYTIQFETFGGSNVSEMDKDFGETLSEPSSPTKEGYQFIDWYRDENLLQPFEFDFMPAEDVIVYAKWEASIYDIQYELNGGTFEPLFHTYTIENQNIGLSEPTKVGHTFDGWYANAQFTGNPIPSIESGSFGDVTLFAKWSINSYQIHFETNLGSTIPSITLNFASSLPTLPSPTRVGYTFGGWYADEALLIEMTMTVMPANDMTIYANWTLNLYDITLYPNAGTLNQTDFIYSIESSEILLPNPVREGYTFTGWYQNPALTGETIVSIPTGNVGHIDFFAGWVINDYEVHLLGDGYDETLTLAYQSILTLPTLSADLKPGYTFLGWSLNGARLNETFIVPSQDVTLTAVYEGNTTLIRFLTPEGEITVEATSGEAIMNLPSLNLPNTYVFLGWSLSPLDASQIIDLDYLVPNSETLQLYPIWIQQENPSVLNPVLQQSKNIDQTMIFNLFSFSTTIIIGMALFITAYRKNRKHHA